MIRRHFLRVGIGSAIGAALFPSEGLAALRRVIGQDKRRMIVYKTPQCGCCTKWVDHVKGGGFVVEVRDLDDLTEIKKRYGVPPALQSCHTGVVGRFAIEGHVPVDVITAYIDRPRGGMAGLAVAGMPVGSPGMEVPGRRADHYDVIGFYRGGRTFVYASR